MSAAEKLYRHAPIWAQKILLNAHALRIEAHRYGPPFRRALRDLLQSERAPREDLDAVRDRKLREILRFAATRSPFYARRLVEHGIDAEGLQGAGDWSRLPILTKEEVRAHGPEMRSAERPVKGWLHGHTSGTTGAPLSLWYDRSTCIMTNAVDARQKAWGGLRDGDWIGVFLGRVIVPTKQDEPPFWRANHVQRQVWFSSFHLQPRNLGAYVGEIRRRGLRFLEGYPSTLYIIARHLRDHGETLPMASVFTSSETLHDVQREAIEAAFGCPIFDFYGHAERTIFAAECEHHSGKHLADEYGYTEVVDQEDNPVEPGEVGFLVGTSFHNTAMPLIRYRTSDVSAMIEDPCPCGRTLRRIEDITTKAEDIIVTADGRFLSPSVLTHPFKPFDQIRESQIVQTAPDRLDVYVVAGESFGPKEEAGLLRALMDRVGKGMRVEIERVENIPREPSGKFRWVVSRVPHALRFNWDR